MAIPIILVLEITLSDLSHSQVIETRREFIFLAMAGLFICAMTLLNVLGITRFIELGPLQLAIGVLPYPITFLCTDLISEFYGKRKANQVVFTGLLANIFVVTFVIIANYIPSVDSSFQPPWQTLKLAEDVILPNGQILSGETELFTLIYGTTMGAVTASMIAYVAAQFCDVFLYHFWKKLTRGKHLWLRNIGSTVVSQLIDAISVISITFGIQLLTGAMTAKHFAFLILSNYAFKFAAALLDTIPIYILSGWLERYLEIDPKKVFD
jgi:queuosine precursor transporter